MTPRESDLPAEPFVSIIVPVRNAERTLGTTLDHLLALDYPTDRLEILLADGGSTDATVSTIRQWQERFERVKLVEVADCTSPGHARNAALRLARGDFVLFTDGDCAPSVDWVRRLLAPFRDDHHIGGVGGEVLTLRTAADNLTEAYCEQTGFLSVSGRCGISESGYLPAPAAHAPHEVNGGNDSPFFATANVAFRREAIDAVGGAFWPEPTGEDVDFSLRVQEKGYRLYFAKDATVRHMHRVSLASYMKQWYGYGYGHPLLLTKHADDVLELAIQTGPRPLFLKLRLPWKGIVHVGAFHLMHLFGASALLTGAAALLTPAALPPLAISALMLAASAISYFAPCLRLRPLGNLLGWCKIRYLSNLAFVRGALDGCRRFGSLCIEPSW